jgi:hypothetical protein
MKRKIKLNKYFIQFCFLAFLLSCNCLKEDHEKDLIRKAIFSKEFEEYFQICRYENEIFIFNDSKKNTDLIFSEKNSCLKTINFYKIDFNYEINSLTPKYKGIVFLGIEKQKNIRELHFFDLETNLSLRLKYNKNKKLIGINVGNF